MFDSNCWPDSPTDSEIGRTEGIIAERKPRRQRQHQSKSERPQSNGAGAPETEFGETDSTLYAG